MNTNSAPRPLFAVPSPTPVRSLEDNVKALGTVSHVVEVTPSKTGWTYALVHAAPLGVAKIAQELGLEVYRSKRGEDYYAVVVAKVAAAPVQPSVPAVRAVPPVQVPVARPPVTTERGTVRMEIKGQVYVVRETATKRRCDVRRFEVRKDEGDVITEPYVVSFQDQDAREMACSCPDYIYRRRVCKHQAAIKAHFAKARQTTIPLAI